MNILATITSGSHLYGLATPTSDFDSKRVYLPELRDLILARHTRVLNVHDPVNGVDSETFSLQAFGEFLCEGQSIALEMISAPPEKWQVRSPAWETLYLNRHRFYTKRCQAFLGYCRSQASKYIERADRFVVLSEAMEVLKKAQGEGVSRLYQIWDRLPEGNGTEKTVNERDSRSDKRVYSIAGRMLQSTLTIESALEVLGRIHESFGERVRAVQANQKADLKSLSHAFRVAYQVKQLCETGQLSFPLPERDFIFAVKTGQLNFQNDGLGKKLDDLILEVEEKLAKSSLPSRPDRQWLDDFIVSVSTY